MPFDSAFDSAMLDSVLRETRTADGLYTRAALFRRAASLCWEVSWAANQAINNADPEIGAKGLSEIADRVNGDWRLMTIAIYDEAVAMELSLKAIIASDRGYDAAEAYQHGLMKLVDEIVPTILADQAIERLVWNLEQALMWQGRYPTPTAKRLQAGAHRRPSKRVAGKSNMAGEIFHEDLHRINCVFDQINLIAESKGIRKLAA